MWLTGYTCNCWLHNYFMHKLIKNMIYFIYNVLIELQITMNYKLKI